MINDKQKKAVYKESLGVKVAFIAGVLTAIAILVSSIAASWPPWLKP